MRRPLDRSTPGKRQRPATLDLCKGCFRGALLRTRAPEMTKRLLPVVPFFRDESVAEGKRSQPRWGLKHLANSRSVHHEEGGTTADRRQFRPNSRQFRPAFAGIRPALAATRDTAGGMITMSAWPLAQAGRLSAHQYSRGLAFTSVTFSSRAARASSSSQQRSRIALSASHAAEGIAALRARRI